MCVCVCVFPVCLVTALVTCLFKSDVCFQYCPAKFFGIPPQTYAVFEWLINSVKVIEKNGGGVTSKNMQELVCKIPLVGRWIKGKSVYEFKFENLAQKLATTTRKLAGISLLKSVRRYLHWKWNLLRKFHYLNILFNSIVNN